MYYVSPRNHLKLAISPLAISPMDLWYLFVALINFYWFVNSNTLWGRIVTISVPIFFLVAILNIVRKRYMLLLHAARRTGLNTDQLKELRNSIDRDLYEDLLKHGTRQNCETAMSIAECARVSNDSHITLMNIGFAGLRAEFHGLAFDRKGALKGTLLVFELLHKAAENFKFGDEPPMRRVRPPMRHTPSSPPGHARDRRLRLAT